MLKKKSVTLECIDGVITLDRIRHSSLPLKNLSVSGVYYSIEDSSDGFDRINFQIDHAQSSITVETIIDTVDIDDGAKHQRLLDYLSDQDSVQITKDGIMEESLYKDIQGSVMMVDKTIPFSVHRYGPIWINLDVGNPCTVGELIQVVEAFRKEVYRNVS